jgi:hypothetical protein
MKPSRAAAGTGLWGCVVGSVAAIALAAAMTIGCSSASNAAQFDDSTSGPSSGGATDGASTPGDDGGASFETGSGFSYDAGVSNQEGDDGPSSSFDAGMDTNLTFQCSPVVAGVGSVGVNNGLPRTFYVDLPADTSKPMALLFSWHGYRQDPISWKLQVGFNPNGASMPIAIVTPVDTGLFLPFGLDWYILGAKGNIDFPYFEGMLHCLKQQYNVDQTRIYSYGFSAGAVMTNLLSAQYPHLFAATVSESGAWFSDPAQVGAIVVGLGYVLTWDWPALNPADRGNNLMTHGGPGDFATIISIEAAAQSAVPYLLKNNRTFIDCGHLLGHAIDPFVTQQMIYEYLLAHQLGKPSPFQADGGGLFPDFAGAICTLNVPTN